jgi:hypothetical protein
MHDGGDVGFESRLILAPDDAVAVVAMTNSQTEAHDMQQLTTTALKIMLDLKPTDTTSTGSVVAASGPTEETKQKADEVLATYVSALGGRAALEKINSRIGKGTFEVLGLAMSGPAEIYAKAPNKTLTTMTVPGQATLKVGFDGAAGWQQDPEDGVVEKTGVELGTAMRDADFYQPLKLRAQYPNLFRRGESKISLHKPNGQTSAERDVIVLEAPRNGNPRRFYFDKSTGLLVRSEERNQADKVTSAIEYDDYSDVDGVKVPFVIHYIEDVHFVIKLTEVKQNASIDDSIFIKPKK